MANVTLPSITSVGAYACLRERPSAAGCKLQQRVLGQRPRRPRAFHSSCRPPWCCGAAAPSGSVSGAATDDVSTPVVCQQSFYDWQFGARINYLRAGTSGPCIVMLHGFGVGAYHYQRNITELAKTHRVWALDLVGMGKSWPMRPPEPGEKLRYSLETWTEQVKHFLDEHVREPAYIMGNSLGGYLSVCLASAHPECVKGLLLLNATPFWSFRPHDDVAGALWKLLPLDGTVPSPQMIKSLIERVYWDNLKQPATVKSLLGLVYASPDAADDELVRQIIEVTEEPYALDAFVSILFSPRSRRSFDEMVTGVTSPICMAYGREDPWVVPLWGQRLKRLIPAAQYYELSPAGHCPHHETPAAVNWLTERWVSAVEQQSALPLRLYDSHSIEEADGRVISVTHVDGSPRNVFERIDHALWALRQRWAGRAVARHIDDGAAFM